MGTPHAHVQYRRGIVPVILMEPMIRSSVLLTLEPYHSPSSGSRLAKIITCVGLEVLSKSTLCEILRLHSNIPEELIIHDPFLMFGPIISELRNLKIELSDGVRSQ